MSKKLIAEKLDRSVNEIFRMLQVLEDKQYISFDYDTSSYTLTLKMFALSNQHSPIALLLKQAKPLLEKLCHKVNQSCHISMYSNGELVVIAKQESPYKMGFSLQVGSQLNICSSGSGIVLLTFSDEVIRHRILNTIDDTEDEKQTALNELDLTRLQGYFVGSSPQISGITNISAPVFDVYSGVMAIITIPFMTLNSNTVHHHIENIEFTRNELLTIANKLSQNL
ncbi:hypothetical transcriptional regulator [Photobacterium profundum SS9]|uniref:Hypothetical transcriptional regulator n=2 Tax=Photobacterium profundum TaxID=74109 RepID=Q6LGJ3_PHOPR|nr:hypothetical transcriptional regulator [Photobacterium profundum SS9]